jgi:pimeloyl-ACP methyl ester carboxylesterase
MAPIEPLSATDRRLWLPDGRWLAYADYGDPAGRPILCFHGSLNSRLMGLPNAASPIPPSLRLIVIDRPGFGLSDFKPRRTLLDWPDDVETLADALGLARFAVVGFAAGGPYVAVCAYKLPHRLTAAAMISSAAPFDTPGLREALARLQRPFFVLYRRIPRLMGLSLGLLCRVAKLNLAHFFALFHASLPPPDRAILARPEIRTLLITAAAEALRAGPRGQIWDGVILARPWGFPLHKIRHPIHLWQGEADTIVPPSVGQTLARTLPNCHATFLPNEGHFLLMNRWQEILSALTP